MKTKPIHNLLPLPIDPRAEIMLCLYHDALHELVCYGTNILDWSLKKSKIINPPPNELAVAAPLLFRHIIEQLDSISIQMKSGVVTPCRIQLRAILEASLSLEWMLDNEEKREQRAACFFITDHYRNLNNFLRLKADSENNWSDKNLESYEDLYLSLLNVEVNVDNEILQLRSLIDLPHYQEANKEYLRYTNQNTNSKARNGVKWYTLFKGPESLFDLAVKLRKKSLYDHFYKPWSDPTHGTNLAKGVLDSGSDGLGTMNQLRVLVEARELTEMALLFGLTTYEFFISQTLQKEKDNFRKWSVNFLDQHVTKVKKIKIRTDPDTGEIFAVF